MCYRGRAITSSTYVQRCVFETGTGVSLDVVDGIDTTALYKW